MVKNLNPYQTPVHPQQPAKPESIEYSIFPGLAIVRRIRTVAILLFTQGGLLALCSFTGALLATGSLDTWAQSLLAWGGIIGESTWGEIMRTTIEFLTDRSRSGFSFGAIAVVSLLALMHFLAGYWALDFRGRLFGITTILLGLTSVLIVVLAPTAILLAAYGVFTYFHPAAERAFQLRAAGIPAAEIHQRFR